MFSDKYFDKFKSLCASDSSTMQIQDLRRIILFRSNGLCPASLIASKSDGSYLSAKEMCNADTYAIVKRKSMFQFPQDMEMFVEKSRQTEIKLLSSGKVKCALGSGPLSLLHDRMEIYKDDCKAFRKSLLESKDLNIVAIHLCRWDGSPRKSISEIRDAICLYPSSPQQMNAFLKFFLKSLVVMATVVAIDQLLLSESAQVSKHQCGATTVTLIGESHAKKFRSNFLPKFVEQLQQEKDALSVVFVEARPWEHTYDYMKNTPYQNEFAAWNKIIDSGTTGMIQTYVKYRYNPVMYFQSMLKFRLIEDPLPRHEIVPYDYRALPEISLLYRHLKKITPGKVDFAKPTEIDVKLPIEDSAILRQEISNILNFQYQRLVNIFPDLAKHFQILADRLQREIFTPNLSQDAANKLVNELWDFFTSIPDTTLLETLKPYVKRGVPNIYVFMGYNHIPPVSKALEQQLACTSKK